MARVWPCDGFTSWRWPMHFKLGMLIAMYVKKMYVYICMYIYSAHMYILLVLINKKWCFEKNILHVATLPRVYFISIHNSINIYIWSQQPKWAGIQGGGYWLGNPYPNYCFKWMFPLLVNSEKYRNVVIMWINCKHTLFSLSVIWGVTVMWDFWMDTWGEKVLWLFWEWAQ